MIYAIVPARSGSRGVPDKNVRTIDGVELLGYAIKFAHTLGVDRVICSTDSAAYAAIAQRHGAEVPFLRSAAASSDTAMEEHVLADLYEGFGRHGIPEPDLFVWLRPTFPLRDRAAVLGCIEQLQTRADYTACRVVIEAEARLYRAPGDLLEPAFPDGGRSMIRRQEIEPHFRVFNTDVFRGRPWADDRDFLGRRVSYVVADKLCGLDIDDERDLEIATAIITHCPDRVQPFLPWRQPPAAR